MRVKYVLLWILAATLHVNVWGVAMNEDLSILSLKANPADLTLSYGKHPDQVADLRYGQGGEQLPLLVLIHGGFWKPEYDRAHAEAMSTALAEAGWTVLTLEYRRLPGMPDATLADIAAALTTLPTKIRQHNGKLILVGHSAGGHLALWAAAQPTLPKIQSVLALAPAADLRLSHALSLGDGAVQKFLGALPAERPDVDPIQLRAATAMVTIVHGESDEIVPLAITQSYLSTFPDTNLVRLPDTGHFALIDPRSRAWNRVMDALAAADGAKFPAL